MSRFVYKLIEWFSLMKKLSIIIICILSIMLVSCGNQADGNSDGLLRQEEPAMLAFAYTSPISSLIHLCDREPEKTDDAVARAEGGKRFFFAWMAFPACYCRKV